MMDTDYPYVCMRNILKEGRQELIDDVLNRNFDLYLALYKDLNSEVYRVHLALYELKWIKSHWDKILYILEQKNLAISDKKQLIATFADWYKDFIKKWNYSALEGNLFNEKVEALQRLIVTNEQWEMNLKSVKVSFEKSQKILNDKKAKLERKYK